MALVFVPLVLAVFHYHIHRGQFLNVSLTERMLSISVAVALDSAERLTNAVSRILDNDYDPTTEEPGLDLSLLPAPRQSPVAPGLPPALWTQ